MKNLLFASLFLIAGLFLSAEAQFDSGYPKLVRGNQGLEVLIEATLDTAAQTYDSLATGWIDISDFDDPVTPTQLYYLFTSAAGSPNVLIDIWGNESTSWTGAVNIIQLVDTTTSEAATYADDTWSNQRPKYINVVIEQVASGRDNTDVSAVLRFPIKDPKVRDE